MGFDLYMLKEPKFQIAPGYWRGLGGVVEAMIEAGVLDTETGKPEIDAPWPPPGVQESRAKKIIAHLRDDEPLEITPTAEEMAACRAYHAAYEAYEAWAQSRSPFSDKVPAYKYDANEGMHVVPEECALIAAALEKLLEDPPEDLAERCDWDDDEDTLLELIEDWKDYNFVASTHGGYRVC